MARLTLLLASALLAASAWAVDLGVSGAWIRQLPAGVPAGAYFTLANHGQSPAALVAASSPDYGTVMIHRTVEHGGTASMVMLDRVEVPARGKIEFRPGGYHLMLMRAKRDIKLGAKVPITLEFADGQKLTVQFEVRGAGAQ